MEHKAARASASFVPRQGQGIIIRFMLKTERPVKKQDENSPVWLFMERSC